MSVYPVHETGRAPHRAQHQPSSQDRPRSRRRRRAGAQPGRGCPEYPSLTSPDPRSPHADLVIETSIKIQVGNYSLCRYTVLGVEEKIFLSYSDTKMSFVSNANIFLQLVVIISKYVCVVCNICDVKCNFLTLPRMPRINDCGAECSCWR